MEDGQCLRGDTTTTKTNIHYPTDASLLEDGVRVLTRAMNRLKEWCEVPLDSVDHSKRAKTKLYNINNTHKEKVRHANYLELIRVTRETVGYAKKAIEFLPSFSPTQFFNG